MSQYGFYFDGTRCTECKTCELACKDRKDLSADVNFRKLFEVTGGTTDMAEDGTFVTSCVSYAVSAACMHCDHPACMAACPAGAIVKDEQTGLVSVDAAMCDGCGTCTTVCPYHAITIDPATSLAAKCDGCKDRVAQGLKPVCVLACPARALDFGLVDDLAQMGGRVDILPFGDPEMTGANMYIVPSADAQKFDSGADLAVANPLEVM